MLNSLHHVAYEGGDLAGLATALQARGVGIMAGPRPAPTGWDSVDVDPATTLGLVTQLSRDREEPVGGQPWPAQRQA